ncbi:IS110 family transposase [Thiocystis violascens]|uniref:Transposase n=1 Tax=Thiocystis violascens (strain ATCC 17096 / DSM 198 / 6111) TaxID=765911 RepID=I3YBQ8_THIV6|nr:IS110 family transposase [Thiocystis violascens]AFL74426.1 transposase [Thiocystis violascens DSM 198]
MISLGIDVSKAKLHLCLLREADGKQKTKVIENTRAGIATLLDWLARQDVERPQAQVILEATGVYHEAVTEALHAAGIRVCMVNPKQIKDFARGLAVRTKTDGIDAFTLARFGHLVNPPAWEPPPPAVRELRALLLRQQSLAEDLRRERNRRDTVAMTTTPALVLTSLDDTIAFLEQELAKLQGEIDAHPDRHPDLKADLQLLTSIPAVGHKVGAQLLVVLREHDFQCAEQAAAYLGVVPIERQSGTSVHGRPRLSKAGPSRVRAILYMAAIVAIRYNPQVKALYERLLARGKSKMADLGAAMRKLVHLCFGVLKNRTPYQADYTKAA